MVDVGTHVGDCGMRYLHHKGFDKFEKKSTERLTSVYRHAKFIRGYPLSLPGDLDVCGIGRLFVTQHHGCSTHPFASNEINFHSRFIRLDSDH